jgi:hypothetical protein
MREFNEGNALSVTARFRSGTQEIIPSTIHYKLVNLTVNSTIIDWTQVIPVSATVEIVISALDMDVELSSSRYEMFEVTVVADKDTADQCVAFEQLKINKVSAIN